MYQDSKVSVFVKLGKDTPFGWYVRTTLGNDHDGASYTGPFKSRAAARVAVQDRPASVPGIQHATVNHADTPSRATTDDDRTALPPFTAMPKLTRDSGLIKAWEAATTGQRRALVDWIVSKR